jgi:polyisoprenoid-binding protein YceI
LWRPTVDTQSAYRDKDVKGADFFNIERFPTMTFKSTSVKRAGKGLKIFGDLTLAGVTKPVILDATEPSVPQKGMQGGLLSGIEATTSIKRSNFAFAAKYPSAVVGDDIHITIDVEMDQK